ncbi:hypothetical protein AK812_SmicGene20111 [Symbiodinium microadriaticum]|uniref:Endonuclease/exonuclease/phosphatase domain-containing protein n=1 Tax=Symbiodinium microadriaticum TaxID=2951 RepID=A0A1Q9DQS8_SYMMI|nr:hypothetical protein AK812_SmicGene20111 [Symbiodinium microadriaticum]
MWIYRYMSSAHRLERVFGTAEALQVVPQVVLGLFLRPQGKAAPFLVTNMHLKSRVQEKLLPAGMDYTAFKHFQLEHFLLAARSAAEQYAPGTSVLCCGDMNLCLLGDPGASQVVMDLGFQDTGATSAGGTAPSPVDFILARSAPGTVVAQAALELPAIDYTQQLPNASYPSDHVLRAVKLRLMGMQARTQAAAPVGDPDIPYPPSIVIVFVAIIATILFVIIIITIGIMVIVINSIIRAPPPSSTSFSRLIIVAIIVSIITIFAVRVSNGIPAARDEFDCDFSQLAAARLDDPVAEGILGQIEPSIFDALGVEPIGHRLLLARGILRLAA